MQQSQVDSDGSSTKNDKHQQRPSHKDDDWDVEEEASPLMMTTRTNNEDHPHQDKDPGIHAMNRSSTTTTMFVNDPNEDEQQQEEEVSLREVWQEW